MSGRMDAQPNRRTPEDTRRQIIEAAIELAAEQGVAADLLTAAPEFAFLPDTSPQALAEEGLPPFVPDASAPLTLARLAATERPRLSSPGVPPFLANQESRFAPSSAALRDLRAAAPSLCCPTMRIEAALVRLEPKERTA